MNVEDYLEIGESNFADENSKNPTELINTKFAMKKMYAKWYHVFLEDPEWFPGLRGKGKITDEFHPCFDRITEFAELTEHLLFR